MPEVTDEAVATETQEEVEPTPSSGGGGSKGMIVKVAIFVVIGMVAVVAAYFVTLKVVKPMMAPSAVTEETAPAVEEEAPAVVEEAGEHGSGEGGHGEAVADAGDADFFNFDNIVVNPAGTAGTRFLSCSVSFQMTEEKDHKAFEHAEVQIKDLLITILSSKTVDELSDIDSRNKMRLEILRAVNKLVAPASAKAVYLVDFVLQ